MANPAVLAGLIAGYTVGAVVTALAVARDEPRHDPLAAAAMHPSSARAVCARMTSGRRVARCLRSLETARALSSPRR